MTDTMTKQPLRVLTYGTAGPFLQLPLAQVDEVRAVLDKHGIWYWVNETAIALDGKNFTTIMDFGRNGDAAKIQAILDAAG